MDVLIFGMILMTTVREGTKCYVVTLLQSTVICCVEISKTNKQPMCCKDSWQHSCIVYLCPLYTVVKKTGHYIIGDNFVKCEPIFTILAPLERELNFKQTPCILYFPLHLLSF